MEISVGQPLADGQYVCYVDNRLLPAFTERKILMWFKGQWSYPMSDQTYRGRIYGWIGPLPVRKTEAFPAVTEYDL